MTEPGSSFLYDTGHSLLMELSNGKLQRVEIIKRIYTSRNPAYVVKVFGSTHRYEVQQEWLRPLALSPSELKQYMVAHSPPGSFGEYAPRYSSES